MRGVLYIQGQPAVPRHPSIEVQIGPEEIREWFQFHVKKCRTSDCPVCKSAAEIYGGRDRDSRPVPEAIP